MQERKDYTEEELRAYLLKAEEEQEDYMVQLSIARKDEEEDERAVYRAELELEQMREGCGAEDWVIKGLIEKKAGILAEFGRKRTDFLDELDRQSKEHNREYDEEAESIHHRLRRQIYKQKDGG